jgi:hypothetical protein
MASNKLSISVAGQPMVEVLEALAATAYFDSPPPKLAIEGVVSKAPSKWVARLAGADTMTQAFWPDEPDDDYGLKAIAVSPRHESVTVNVPDAFKTRDEAISIIESLPFSLLTFGPVRGALDVEPQSFVGHVPLSWGCAFRGGGHNAVVSRRWLEFGPWELLERPDDLSIVFFHDLNATKAAAAKQAAPGHEFMTSRETGGYVRAPNPVKGLYEATERKLEIVVDPGDEVSEKEMTNAAWTRAHKRTGKDRIDHLAFVFMKQNDAKLHLHEMWLRELEVWYVDGKGNHRIDEDYAPKPNRPAWAKGK